MTLSKKIMILIVTVILLGLTLSFLLIKNFSQSIPAKNQFNDRTISSSNQISTNNNQAFKLSADQIGLKTIKLGGLGSQGLAIDEESGWVYIGNNGSTLCRDTNNLVTTTDATGANTLSIVDLDQNKEIFLEKSGGSPIWPTVDQKRKVVYVANSSSKNVVMHDLKTGKLLSTIEVGGLPHLAAISKDGIMVVSNTNDGSQKFNSAVDLDHGNSIAHYPSPMFPHGIVYDEKQNLFYMGGVEDGEIMVIDGKTGQAKTRFYGNEIKGNSSQLALLDNKLYLAISEPNPGGINVIDTQTLKIIKTIKLENRGVPPTSIAIDQNNQLLYVVLADADLIGVVDLQKDQMVASIAVGNCPYAIRIDPMRARAIVTNAGDNTISIFDLELVTKSIFR